MGDHIALSIVDMLFQSYFLLWKITGLSSQTIERNIWSCKLAKISIDFISARSYKLHSYFPIRSRNLRLSKQIKLFCHMVRQDLWKVGVIYDTIIKSSIRAVHVHRAYQSKHDQLIHDALTKYLCTNWSNGRSCRNCFSVNIGHFAFVSCSQCALHN